MNEKVRTWEQHAALMETRSYQAMEAEFNEMSRREDKERKYWEQKEQEMAEEHWFIMSQRDRG
jgi:hypothetical protein